MTPSDWHLDWHLVVPGTLEQRTGGYIYDRRVVEGLRRLGRPIRVHSLDGRFPGPAPEAEQALDASLAGLLDASVVLVDGLALGAYPAIAARHASRLAILGLVHLPLHEETGLSSKRAAELERLERAALQSCRGLIATSRFMATRLQAWLKPSPPVRFVTPGTDRITKTKAMPQKPREPRLLCVGSLVPRKGQDLLIAALAQLRERPWHCLLAGSDTRDPDFAEKLRAQIRSHELDGRVEMLGDCTEANLHKIYPSVDLFVLPTWYESYGMAFTEAMAHGLPVVSTTGGAIPDTVPHSAGFLVTPGDVPALVGVLSRLLDEPDLRARLAQGARQHAATLPDWERTASDFALAVEALVAS